MLRDSRDKKHHYIRKGWPQQHIVTPEKMKILVNN
jgi:hypothetical protein